jgi:(E)-4-hydroxy-3-methylbut-2-enyl-diphosphate synthase
MIGAGAEIVRLTTQGTRELRSLVTIRETLHRNGFEVPVAADIHFKPQLAIEAARVADKIRINPGTYLKGSLVGQHLPHLLSVCKQHGTTIRIGVNQGSLDEAILREYGDTPVGMVESAMRFLRICQQEEVERVVVSMKSSNPRVMIHSVRLLASTMAEEGMDYPIHLGVTEAGDGAQGRIKSAAGIAPLLLDGLGDTIRVSLTEPPENELPVAREITRIFQKPSKFSYPSLPRNAWNPFSFQRRVSLPVLGIGNASRVKIISEQPPLKGEDLTPGQVTRFGVTFEAWKTDPSLLGTGGRFLLLERGDLSIPEILSRLDHFCSKNSMAPVVYKTRTNQKDPDLLRIALAGELGSLLADGAVDAVQVESGMQDLPLLHEILLLTLQAAGGRISRTEYIACPSCGRTHFDILARLKEIKEATSHLVPIKIGVMGCIVNGPGEMADADFGYVGAGPGRVTLYKGKTPVMKNLSEERALEALIALLKKEGAWQDPPSATVGD